MIYNYLGGDIIKKYIDIKNKLKTRQREITLILVTAIVLILFFAGFSIGKEIANTKIEVDAQIAEPILEIENNPSISITANQNKGKYDFIIKNYNKDNKITEVELDYTIEIISKLDEGFSIKIYKDGEELQLENQKTQILQLGKKQKEEHNYQLEIIYDKEKSISIQDIIEDLQIKVHSEQKKA